MGSSEIEQMATLSRQEVARWLADLARMVEEGGNAQIALTGPPIALDLPDEFRCELEIELDSDGGELEIELKWRSDSLTGSD